MMSETEKEVINLLILAESALFYCLNDGDKHAESQAKETVTLLREFLDKHKAEIISQGI